MRNPFRIETIWGESGPQKSLQRRPGVSPPIPEQIRQQAGKLLGSSSYGTAVPIAVGQIKTPAVLIESLANSATYLVCEGEVDNLGQVSYDGKNATPYIEDPANFAPGTDSQGTGGATKLPYPGRCIAWRSIAAKDQIPSLAYEVNGRPSETLQDVALHYDGPTSTDRLPLNYQAESWIRGEETHLVYVVSNGINWNLPGASWSILYRASTDGGFNWSAPDLIATVTHPMPAPIIFGDPDGNAVQIVWFQKRQWLTDDLDVDVRNVYKTTGAWSSSRSVFTYSYTANPIASGQIQLNGSCRGGRVWVGFQDIQEGSQSNYSARLCVAPLSSGSFTNRELKVEAAPGWSRSLFVEGAYVSACQDGTAAIAFHIYGTAQNVYKSGLQIQRVVVEGGVPDWSPSARSAVGRLKYDIASDGPRANVHWADGRRDSLADVLTDVPQYFGQKPWGLPNLPHANDYEVQGFTSAWYRLEWLGTVAGKPDCWMLLYRSGTNSDDAVKGVTRWKIRVGSGFNDLAPIETEMDLTGWVHTAPRWSLQGNDLYITATQADIPMKAGWEGWSGCSIAWRWHYDLSTGQAEYVDELQRMSYVAGKDDYAHAAIPTKNGMVIHEYGDFNPGDAQVGRASRLVAWDPTAESVGGDVDPLGILVRALVSEKHLGPVWRAESGEFFTIVKNAEETDKYCRIMGFQFSDSITSQVGAWDHIAAIMASANCDAVWSDGRLEFVPHEVLSLAGGGETWTPQTGRASPAYSLSASDFLAPLQPSRRPASEEKSILPISFSDRPQNYRTNTLDLMDAGTTEYRGAKKASTVDCPWITRKSVAGTSAWLRLRKNAISRTTWEGRLPWRFQRLQAMDLVSVTEPRLGLNGEVCRVRRLTRHSDCSLTVVLESAGSDYSVPTSPILDDAGPTTPVWFAPSILDAALAVVPAEYTGQAAPGVLFAVAGPPTWQGSDIWVRWVIAGVPTDWELVGEVLDSTPMGVLSEPMGSLVPRPDLRPHAGLMPGAQDDWAGDFGLVQLDIPSPAASYSTGIPPALAKIGNEFAAHFERANGVWVHRAKTLRRGLWGSIVETHAPGTRVVVFRAGTPTWIVTGRGTLEVRFPSKATRGSAAEPLEATRSYFVEVT